MRNVRNTIIQSFDSLLKATHEFALLRAHFSKRGVTCGLAIGTAVLFLCAAVSWAAEEQNPTVIVKAEYKVVEGKLQVEYLTDRAAEDTLAKFYGSERLARTFRKQVFKEVNASLEALNPIAEWKASTGAGREKIDVSRLISTENLPRSRDFSGPLKEWLPQFLIDKKYAGTFFTWSPTRPPGIEEDSEKHKVMPEISVVLSSIATSLIGKVDQREVSDSDPRTATLNFTFHKALQVKKVNIVGMDFPEELSGIEKDDFRDFQRQKVRFEHELSTAATGLALAWSDDLAVQRMMVVLRARGMWNEFPQADEASPRAVHWLTFHTNCKAEVEADVHLPHLCHILFGTGADSNDLIKAVTKILLSRDEWEVIQRSLAVQGSTADKDQFLKHIIAPIPKAFGEGRFVDLFALSSYRGHLQTGKESVRFPPLPVKESWLTPRLEQIRDMGWYVSAAPAQKGESRLVDSGSAERKASLNGGIDIIISPPPAKIKDTSEGGAAETNDQSFKRWIIDTVKYRAEAGARAQDSQRVDWLARLSASHTETFGSLSTEVSYQYRLSAKFDWQPPNSEDTPLPSHVGAFTESAPRRIVEGQNIEIERKGFRIGKQKSFGSLNFKPRLDADLELAQVYDVAGFIPNADELRAPLVFSLFTEPNLWDAREFWNIRASAIPSVRWRSETDVWCLAGSSGQIRRPYGSWDYFGSFDVRWAAGAPPLDALPYLGGMDGVRGVRPYGVPAKARVVVRNELWSLVPFIERDIESDQRWYGLAYENLRLAGFVDVGWASGIREKDPTDPWFVGPGAGVRLIVMRGTHLSLDYAYGICEPSVLGGHRFSLSVTTRY